MIESIILVFIVGIAAFASSRYLFREVASGKRKCSGCGDDCPLAKTCACNNSAERAAEKAPRGCPVTSGHAE